MQATANIQLISVVTQSIILQKAIETNCGRTVKILVRPSNAPASSGLFLIVYSDSNTKGIHNVIDQHNPSPDTNIAPKLNVILSITDSNIIVPVKIANKACDIAHNILRAMSLLLTYLSIKEH